MKIKIRKGDTVEVISGRFEDKGKRGEVIRVDPGENRVVVQTVNMRKKHQAQMQTKGRPISGGIIEFEGPISISNVMLVCPVCKEKTRVGIHREGNEVQRFCKKCKAEFD